MKCVHLKSLLLLGMALVLHVQTAAADVVGVGDPLPSFFLRDINGNNFYLNECIEAKSGEPAAFIFSFCASYCKPCKREIPELDKLQEMYEGDGLSVYLVALEKKELAKTIIDETGTELPLLIDRYLVVQKLMGFNGIPFTVLVDRDGIIRYINTGFSEDNVTETMERFEHAVMDVLGLDSAVVDSQ